tara:strand:+ start:7154 stop:7666 length:513 start_codon:yes stop_codon:yes gene_type:complete
LLSAVKALAALKGEWPSPDREVYIGVDFVSGDTYQICVGAGFPEAPKLAFIERLKVPTTQLESMFIEYSSEKSLVVCCGSWDSYTKAIARRNKISIHNFSIGRQMQSADLALKRGRDKLLISPRIEGFDVWDAPTLAEPYRAASMVFYAWESAQSEQSDGGMEKEDEGLL